MKNVDFLIVSENTSGFIGHVETHGRKCSGTSFAALKSHVVYCYARSNPVRKTDDFLQLASFSPLKTQLLKSQKPKNFSNSNGFHENVYNELMSFMIKNSFRHHRLVGVSC